ncbi:hypothetical protein ACX3VG_04125, partial [Escherichia coli]
VESRGLGDVYKRQNQAITHSITVGSRITVQGFISCHKAKNGLSKMVLHAEQIELIDSGD